MSKFDHKKQNRENLQSHLQNPEKFVRDDKALDAEGEVDEHATNETEMEKERLKTSHSPKT